MSFVASPLLVVNAVENDAMSWFQVLKWGLLPIKAWKVFASILGDAELDDKRTIAFWVLPS